MLAPPSQGARVIARGAPGDWARACAAAAAGASVLKDHAGGTVWRARVLGRECVLKCIPLGSVRRGAAGLVRWSPGWRQWRNGRWLRERGFACGEPLAIVRGRYGGVWTECLVLEFVPGRTVLEHAAAGDLSARAEHRVAEAVAALASRLAREGRMNRDAKPSNLVVVRADGAGAELAMIDCAGLRRRRGGDEIAAVRALASAAIEPMGCGCPVRLGVRARAVREAARHVQPADMRGAFRRLWRRVGGVIEAHGDATPRDDPLA